MDRRIPVNLPTPGKLVEEFSPEYPYVDGVFSRFFPSRRGLERKEVLASAAVRVEDQWYSPSGLSRGILDTIPNRSILGPPGSPLWARYIPPWWGFGLLDDAVFVDIRRAYESILKSFGVREAAPMQYWSRIPVWYPPDPFWSGPGEKHVLRVLPSAGLSRIIRLYRSPHDVRKIRKPPKDFRPWGTVMVVLHAIAAEARRLGAVYWNVDGGILPAGALSEFSGFVESLGLSLHIKGSGPAVVRGRGIYIVGSISSIPFRMGVRGWERDDGMGEFRKWAREMVRMDY